MESVTAPASPESTSLKPNSTAAVIEKVDDFGFDNKEKLYYRSLKDYYRKHPSSVKTMLDIINNESKISLRIIDWFVTRYSKKHRVKYEMDSARDDYHFENSFDVHLNYKAQLKSYTKKYFDPFRRRRKFDFVSNSGEKFVTTLGQLNFFRWAISNKVIGYVDDNYEPIVKSMKTKPKKKKATKKETVKTVKVKGDKEIKIRTQQRVNKDRMHIRLSFD